MLFLQQLNHTSSDNCHCTSCVHQGTLQRNVDVFEVLDRAINPRLTRQKLNALQVGQNIHAKEVTKSDSGVEILCKGLPYHKSRILAYLLLIGSDDHVSVHSWTLLKGAMPYATRSIPRDGQIPFDSTIAEKPREVSYDAVMSEANSSGMAKLTNDIVSRPVLFPQARRG
jgi:hypothetical protein